MSEIPSELRYAKRHEWVRTADDGTVTVGISAHAQEALGDLVFVEIPEVGTSFAAGDACAVVESVKAASDVYAPLAGEVIAANDALTDQPELINQDPYGEGWIIKLKPVEGDEDNDLVDAAAYAEVVAAEV